MIKNKSAIIYGVKGYYLSKSEKFFLKKNKPWGIILFSRNIKNIIQLKKLINDIKITLNESKYPILIDQEGGDVSRLNKIIDLSILSQDYFGRLFSKNKKFFYYNYKLYINSLSSLFNFVGVNINTVPVLDVRRKNGHKIVGTRSFSTNVATVTKLGKVCINFFKENKIATVVKHIPGHGLANVDSHFDTPIVDAKKSVLINKDFKPFVSSKSFFAMTAHVIYKNFDSFFTATHSKKIIKKIIRKKIKFKGIIISDDISMKSLKFNLEENALKSLEAGCNLVLHCNGNLKEMHKLAKVIPKIDKFTQKKTEHFFKFLG